MALDFDKLRSAVLPDDIDMPMALKEDVATHELNVEVALPQRTFRRLTDRRKGFRKQVLYILAIRHQRLELRRLVRLFPPRSETVQAELYFVTYQAPHLADKLFLGNARQGATAQHGCGGRGNHVALNSGFQQCRSAGVAHHRVEHQPGRLVDR